MKKWKINQPDSYKVDNIIKKTDLTRLCAEVMVSRGISEIDDLADFFSCGKLSDPFLLKDMYEAVDCIRDAIDNYSLICIYGDYDCDGVTSTAILYNYIENSGGNVMYYIPEREEGYGLNSTAVKKLSKEDVEIIITVDNGITAIEEAKLISQLGMKLVVTDHHQPGEVLPQAVAVVNPHRKDCPSPFKQLSGVGVVMKLIAALEDGNYDLVLEQYADIVAVGTIADVVPLIKENRIIVKKGLELLSVTENPGVSLLMEKSGLNAENITSTSIAFSIAPRINAAGRFGSPLIALKALISDDEDTENLVNDLISMNTQRKKVEDKIMCDILDSVKNNISIIYERVLVLSGENWHHGVIGIVSSRLIERFGKPNFLICCEGDEARGSARSIEGFNIVECLTYCRDLLTKFGGHTLAGGFSLKTENIDAFKEKIAEYARLKNNSMPVYSLKADKVLTGADFDVRNVDGLKALEPFGQDNSKPLFALLGARINKITPLSSNRHLRLDLFYDNVNISALLFNTKATDFSLVVNDIGDFLAEIEVNEYNNNRSIVLKIQDYRKSGIAQEKYFSAKACYDSYKLGENIDNRLLQRIIPSRDELVVIYKFLISNPLMNKIDSVFMAVCNDNMNYCKFRICLDIFKELELLNIDYIYEEIKFIPPTKKVELENSRILSELRNYNEQKH